MSGSEKSRASFAMTFSDLMMGAMVIIIVLLLFLSVVLLRGQGVDARSAETVYPPGLRARLGAAHARVRLIISPAEYASKLKVTGAKDETPLETGGEGLLRTGEKIAVREIYLRQGLGNTTLHVSTEEALPKNTSVTVSILIGGLLPSPKNEVRLSMEARKDQDLFVISLKNKNIIESAL